MVSFGGGWNGILLVLFSRGKVFEQSQIILIGDQALKPEGFSNEVGVGSSEMQPD